jgi:predicted CXXCH cytochrome family protein
MNCVTCHDPHKSTKYEKGGLKEPYSSCVVCHSDVKMALPVKEGATCASCHMPLASKSATTTGVDGLLGDIHSHTFRLNTDPTAAMFTEDGAFVNLDEEGQAIVKVEFACLDCHNGDVASYQTIDSFYDNARIIHDRWGNASDLGDGWKYSQWLGIVKTDAEPWVYSTEAGWIYIEEKGTELHMYIYKPELGSWQYSNRAIYPWVYDVATDSWVDPRS